ncbi:hypothetical protein TrLO_g14904 [Triparma laevis f. longispina]|uniref:Uncharacterized protein n=1 Tax=Triparma laevis f. longispina TaxID=1714387 RepID=A0A9W7AQY0_9STRA|nr:hypothetical protein TrLO_g14904 [Triparma laevis f. longispina]
MSASIVDIIIDKDKACAGETLSGTICPCLTNASIFLDPHAKITLSFMGREYCAVKFTEAETEGVPGKQEFEEKTVYETRDIINVKQPLEISASNKAAFPFSFSLPQSIPSSFVLSDTNKLEYSITLFVNGKIIGKLKGIEIRGARVTNTNLDAKRFAQPRTEGVKFCSCFSYGSGEITFGGCATSNTPKGDDIMVGYACKNNSNIDLSQITVELRELVYTKAQGHKDTKMTVIASEEINTGSEKLKSALPTNTTVEYDSINKQLFQMLNDDSNAQFAISTEKAVPDYAGRLLKISHTIKITVKTPTKYSPNPSAKIPCCIITTGAVQPIQHNFLHSSYSVDTNGTESINAALKIKRHDTQSSDSSDSSEASMESLKFEYDVQGLKKMRDVILSKSSSSSSSSGSEIVEIVDSDDVSIDDTVVVMQKNVKAAEAILIPLPPIVDHELVPKLDKSSYDDLSILRTWGNEHPHVLKNLTPLQTDSMVLKIKNTMERPEAGEILAKAMGPYFTCKHVMALLAYRESYEKTDMVNRVAGMVGDPENKGEIIAALTKYELLVCGEALKLGIYAEE